MVLSLQSSHCACGLSDDEDSVYGQLHQSLIRVTVRSWPSYSNHHLSAYASSFGRLNSVSPFDHLTPGAELPITPRAPLGLRFLGDDEAPPRLHTHGIQQFRLTGEVQAMPPRTFAFVRLQASVESEKRVPLAASGHEPCIFLRKQGLGNGHRSPLLLRAALRGCGWSAGGRQNSSRADATAAAPRDARELWERLPEGGRRRRVYD